MYRGKKKNKREKQHTAEKLRCVQLSVIIQFLIVSVLDTALHIYLTPYDQYATTS